MNPTVEIIFLLHVETNPHHLMLLLRYFNMDARDPILLKILIILSMICLKEQFSLRRIQECT